MYTTETREQFFANEWELLKEVHSMAPDPDSIQDFVGVMGNEIANLTVVKQARVIGKLFEIIDDCRMDIRNLRTALELTKEGNNV